MTRSVLSLEIMKEEIVGVAFAKSFESRSERGTLNSPFYVDDLSDLAGPITEGNYINSPPVPFPWILRRAEWSNGIEIFCKLNLVLFHVSCSFIRSSFFHGM